LRKDLGSPATDLELFLIRKGTSMTGVIQYTAITADQGMVSLSVAGVSPSATVDAGKVRLGAMRPSLPPGTADVGKGYVGALRSPR
jgi:hypothetical protein